MKTDTPTHPWEIMGFAKDLFGLPYMRRLIGVNSDRQVYRQCTNPNMNYGDEPCLSFIDRSAALLVELDKSGNTEVAVSALAYLSGLVGYEVTKKGEHHPDKNTLLAEIYDDSRTYSAALDAIEAKKHPNIVKRLFQKHRDETKQTENKYTADFFRPPYKDMEQRR